MKAHPRVILAFDFGLKYIGLAIGQEITNTSHTFFSLKANSGLPNWDELDVIVKDWKPELFFWGNLCFPYLSKGKPRGTPGDDSLSSLVSF